MKKIKKLAVICLLIVLTAAANIPVFAAENDISGEATGVLTALNIITQNDLDDFSIKREVTRGEYSVYLARALHLSEGTENTNIFNDLSGHELAKYIDTLYQLNIVNGYNNSFRPDDYITYNEAIKMAVCAANYEMAAIEYGGYPWGYIKAAGELGITDNLNISADARLTKGDAAKIIFNMLTASLIVSDYSGGKQNFVKKEDEDMLSHIFDVYKTKGTVVKNSVLSISSDTNNVEKGEVLIDDTVYKAGNTDAENKIGFKIEFYYLYDDDKEESTIIYINNKYENESVSINSEDIISFKDGVYEYYDGTKTKRASLEKDFSVSYNYNYPPGGFTEAMMIPENGSVRLIKSGGNGKFDAVIIESYTDYIVSSADSSNKIIYLLNGGKIDLTNCEYKIISAQGVNQEIEDIKSENIISVLYSADKANVTIYNSSVRQTAKVSSVSKDGNILRVTADGTEYTSINGFGYAGAISVGESTELFTDYMGKIAYARQPSTDGYKRAYLITAYSDEGMEDDTLNVKLFTQDGTIERIKLTDSVKINDVSYKRQLPEARQNLQSLSEKIVKYSVNEKGEITRLFTYTDDSKYIKKLFEGTAVYTEKQRGFNGKATVKANTPVFVIPPEVSEEDYKIKTLSTFSNDSYYSDLKIYSTTDGVWGDVIIYGTDSAGTERKAAVITNVSECVNDDNETTYQLEILWKGSKRTYMLNKAETLAGCKKGDVVKLALNNDNEISNLLRIYDSENDTMVVSNPYEPQSGAGYRSSNRMYMGYAYLKKDGLLRFGKNFPTESNFETEDLENALLSGFDFYVIDRNDKNIARVGSEEDIIDFDHSKTDASRIIVSTNWYDPEEIFIIK